VGYEKLLCHEQYVAVHQSFHTLKQREGCVVGCINLTRNSHGNRVEILHLTTDAGLNMGTFCSSVITGHSTDDHTPLRVDKDNKSLHNLLCIRSFHKWKNEATVSALTVQK